MDVLVLTTMKNAAKCDTKSELQNPVNLYVFERMLRFRVLLEACLFECLFSPLASPAWLRDGGLWTVRPTRPKGCAGRSSQVERRRVLIRASECCNPFSQPMWCAASVVTKLEGREDRNAGWRALRIVRPVTCPTLQGPVRDDSTFGPQIRQEDPLNLSI